MKRIWSVRINLDEFNSLVGMAFTDRDKIEILAGLAAGMNGAQIPEQCSNGVRAAFESGSKWRSEAEGFQAKQSSAGQASAEARKAKYGDAQPSNGVRTEIEQPSNLTLNLNPLTENPTTEKANSPSRARIPPKKKLEPLVVPDEHLSDLQVIGKDWPRRSDYKGAVAEVSLVSRPADIWERIVKFVPEPDRGLAVQCGLLYLDELDARERGVKGLIPNVCAMTNFYGEKALWKNMIAKVEEKRWGPS